MSEIEQKARDYRISRYRNFGMEPQYGPIDVEVAFQAGYKRAIADRFDAKQPGDVDRLVPRGPFPPRPDESDGAAGPHNTMMEAGGFTRVHGRLDVLYQIVDDLRKAIPQGLSASSLVAEFDNVRTVVAANANDLSDQIRKVQTEQAGIVSLLEAVHGEVSKVEINGTTACHGEPAESEAEAAALDAMIYGTGILRDGKRVDVYRLPEGAGEFRQHVEVFGRHLLLFDGGLYLIEGGKLVKL